jgi:hypothetical protein
VRHLRSILYALVLAPAVWILSGVGFTHDLTGRAPEYGGVETFTRLLLLLLAGTAYAILLLSPISPAGPAAFGVIFLGIGVWALASPSSYHDVWPASVAKDGFDLSLPGYGLAALLALPLICTALSLRRWERYEPPQVPLIGVLGPPHSAAAVAATTPEASATTEIFTRPSEARPPEADPEIARDADPTQVIRLPGDAVEPPASAPAVERATAVPDDPDATVVTDPDRTVVTPLVEEQTAAAAAGATVGEPKPDEDRSEAVEAQGDEPTSETTEAEADEPETQAVQAETEEPETQAVQPETEEPETQAVQPEADEPETQAIQAEADEPETEADEPETHAGQAEGEERETEGPETEAVEAEADEPETEPVEVQADGPEAEADEVEADELKTEVVTLDSDGESDDEAESRTEVVVLDSEGDATQVVEPEAEEPPTEVAGLEPAENAGDAIESEGEEPPTEVAEPDSDDEAVEAVEADARSDETAKPAAVDEAVDATVDEAVDEPQTEMVTLGIDEDDQEKTQVIKLPVGEVATRDLRRRMPDPDNRPTHAIDYRSPAKASGPGERTEVIPLDHGEKTQVIRLPEPAGAERAQAAAMPRTSRPAGEKPAGSDDGERTQVIRLESGTVDAPGDRTQVIKLPVQQPPNAGQAREPQEQPAAPGPEPQRSPSIVAAERPDPGADPTTRLVAPALEPAGEPTTNGKKRVMTVTNLERPQDEAADDTRYLLAPPIPTQRRPDDESS